MSKSPLLSQEWCDLVFEGRNKAYGAYVIRKQTGRRYRWVAMIFGALLLALLAVASVVGLLFYRAVQEAAAELEQVVKLKPIEAEKGFEVKRISTGRRAVTQKTTPGASNAAPVIVDRATIAVPMGIDGPDDQKYTQIENLIDADKQHNADQVELPVEGAQLVKTEVVEELPVFPGGMQALMKFLDDNIIYSGAAQRRSAEGEVLVTFVVDIDGTLRDLTVEKNADVALDRAVVNALRRMPKWKPGKRNGVAVPVKITLPVHFQLK